MSGALPERVGRYRIVRRLGAGGMGEVYEARDSVLRRHVALKCLPPGSEADDESRSRLESEARSAARIGHQNVASLYDVTEEDGRLWLVMELVEGSTLEDLPRPVPLERFLEIAIQCAEALAAAHRRGIVHGDIKPANIIVAADGQVKVLDFGVAGLMLAASDHDETVTSLWQVPGRAGGTVGYCAPEVLLGRPSDQRADLFALGVVLYELLSGRHPFAGSTGRSGGAALDEIRVREHVNGQRRRARSQAAGREESAGPPAPVARRGREPATVVVNSGNRDFTESQ